MPARSVMPDESVTTSGNCAPAVEPAAMMAGPEVIVIKIVLVVVSSVHVALVPQMMSATVFDVEPRQFAGPAFVAVPQSLSVTRITAVGETLIFSLKAIWTLSPLSSVFARPEEDGVIV